MMNEHANFGKVIEHGFEQLLNELPTSVKESDGCPIAFWNFKIHFTNVLLHMKALYIIQRPYTLYMVGIEHWWCFKHTFHNRGYTATPWMCL